VKIVLKYFASLREVCGKKEETLEIPADTTVSGLRKQVINQYPALEEIMAMTLPVVNMEYVEDSHTLEDGDLVSFFPPVSGG